MEYSSFDFTPLADSLGAVIAGAMPLKDIETSEVLDLLSNVGAVYFKGFSASDSEFADFSTRFSRSFLGPVHAAHGRAIASDGGRTMTVNLGNQLVGHHSELSYSPLRPDFLWFHCVVPAKSGGSTLLCDGAAVVEKLPTHLKRSFSTEDIRYVFPEANSDVWPLFTGRRLSLNETLEELAAVTGVNVRRNKGKELLDIEYSTPAIVKSQFFPHRAFSNSIIVSGDDGVEVLHSGVAIDRKTRLQLFSICLDSGLSLDLESGDILMIDNWRVMHGRTAFDDSARRVHVRMSSLEKRP